MQLSATSSVTAVLDVDCTALLRVIINNPSIKATRDNATYTIGWGVGHLRAAVSFLPGNSRRDGKGHGLVAREE
ncbi:hypothetical protein PV325_011353 [Microctonus aethiopoides]|nr:hypothetical protein PV325_011353 [Microctonus aethiopoides]